MAILKAPENTGLIIEEVCPAGTYAAVVGAVEDNYGVERPTYQDPTKMEKVDETKLYFGIVKDGTPYRVGTFPMRLSSAKRSTLYKAISKILGHDPDFGSGWDTQQLVGMGVIVQVVEKESKSGNRYSVVDPRELRPIKDGLSDHSDKVPSLDRFDFGEVGSSSESDSNAFVEQSMQASATNQQPQVEELGDEEIPF